MQKLKKIIIITLIFSIMTNSSLFIASLTPVQAQAAVQEQQQQQPPAKITKALKKAVNENGWCIIIDQCNSKMYIYKKCKSGWKLKKSFRCIVGKRLCKNKHYFLHRSEDIDMLAFGVDYDRWTYGMFIDCYEHAYTNMIHSYVDHYNGKTWKTRKSMKWNPNGISICEKNARWIWRHCKDGTAIQAI